MASKLRRTKPDTFKHYDLIIYAARNSSSARALARTLGCRRWFEDAPERYARRRAFFRGRPYPTIVNWGSTVTPDWGTVASVVARSKAGGAWLNSQEAAAVAINKLETFKCLTQAEVPIPRWTTEKEQVQKWLRKEHTVLIRNHVSGQGGAGISLIQGKDVVVPDAPLYVRNYPKTHEFRVHVFDGQVIDFVEKKARIDNATGLPVVRDRLVRNHDNGWVFAHGITCLGQDQRDHISRTSVSAVCSLGLLFGAVDILAILDPPDAAGTRKLKSAVVCEVNTAPGLECTETINAYSTAILNHHLKIKGINNDLG